METQPISAVCFNPPTEAGAPKCEPLAGASVDAERTVTHDRAKPPTDLSDTVSEKLPASTGAHPSLHADAVPSDEEIVHKNGKRVVKGTFKDPSVEPSSTLPSCLKRRERG